MEICQWDGYVHVRVDSCRATFLTLSVFDISGDMTKPVYRHLAEQRWRNMGDLDLLVCLRPFVFLDFSIWPHGVIDGTYTPNECSSGSSPFFTSLFRPSNQFPPTKCCFESRPFEADLHCGWTRLVFVTRTGTIYAMRFDRSICWSTKLDTTPS